LLGDRIIYTTGWGWAKICYDSPVDKAPKPMTTHRKATNLTDAYEICDVEPLQGQGLDDFYLPLLEARNSEAIAQVEQALQRQKIRFDPELLKDVEDWFKVVTTEDENSVSLSMDMEASASLGSEATFFAKLLFKVKGIFKNSSSRKTVIRETLKKEFTRMKGSVNLLLSDGLKKLRKKSPAYKGILVIVDNLDRCPLAVSDKLFFDYAAQLKGLHCSIIYTVPISALYSSRNMTNAFDDPHIVPMVNIYQLDRAQYPLDFNPQSLEAMVKIIAERVDVKAIFEEREDLITLVKASGGHIRQLMQLMQRACLTASGRDHAKIQIEDVEYAIKQLQFSLERAISNKKYFTELAYVAKNKEFSDQEDIKVQMLYSTAVLEYNGSDRWNYPNPLLMRSHAFTKAINA
jgi:hypothetical protein